LDVRAISTELKKTALLRYLDIVSFASEAFDSGPGFIGHGSGTYRGNFAPSTEKVIFFKKNRIDFLYSEFF
jgi:hypothetical protein